MTTNPDYLYQRVGCKDNSKLHNMKRTARKYQPFLVKVTLLTIAFAIVSLSASAKNISQYEAYNIAHKFYASKYTATRTSDYSLKFCWDSNSISSNTRTANNTAPTFYVFRDEANTGFVIVSGDDTTIPILGYSFDEKISDAGNLPAPFLWWLTNISDEISRSRSMSSRQVSKVSQSWVNPRSGNIVIELETAKWNQHSPYNDQCPMDGAERSLTGCTATAIAIVMRYHKWPTYGKGTTDGYVTEEKGIYVESRNLNHAYNWDEMPLTYNSGYSDNQAKEVATLMADIATAIGADFTSETTSAAVKTDVMFNNFDYNPGMYRAYKENYAYDKWIEILENEISSLRPVLYDGDDSNRDSGHQFVLDGYTDDEYFHVNWGWGGSANGYFVLSALSPYEDYLYDSRQSAIINFKPSTSSEIEDWIKFKSPGIELSETNFAVNQRFYIDKASFLNSTAVDFSGVFCGAITTRNGEIKEWATRELEKTLQNGGWYVTYSNIACTITKPINIGDRLRFFYKSNNSDVWRLIKSQEENCVWEVPIADEYYISECTSFTFDKINQKIILRTKYGVDVTLFSPNNIPVTDALELDDTNIVIDTTLLNKGQYTLILQKGDDVKELKFEIKSL